MPFADLEARREYDRARRRTETYKAGERARSKTRPSKPQMRFIGVDGEGGNINGRHEYLLLRVGEHLLYNNSSPLRTVDILRWLTSLPKQGIYVGFGFDYDVTMILRDWPEDKLRLLMNREARKTKDGKGYLAVGHNGFLVEYLPRKFFRVARWRKDEKPRYFTVHDTIGFFQSSFVQALEAWDIGTPEERAEMQAMKNSRSDFTEATMEEIEYNRQECLRLAELMEDVRSATKDAGLAVTTWEGAGCLAQAMLKKNDAPRRADLSKDLAISCRSAYYGGRFEILNIGPIKPVHEYDLASAYPWAMSLLPCFEHGYWVNEFQPGNPYQVLKVRWATSPDRPWGPYPFRDPDGTILYPSAGTGWYWYPEVKVEDGAGEVNEILDAWSYVRACDHKPFSWIPEMYAERQRIGKSGKGKVLKLGLNSLYGKQAQSVGNPQYASSINAGLITSMVRAVMAQVCLDHGSAVKMIATDGIYLTRKLSKADRPIVEDGKPAPLGAWEHKKFADLFLIKPGIYFTNDGAKVKTRGVPREKLDKLRPELIDAWHRDGLAGGVTIGCVGENCPRCAAGTCTPRIQFFGARMALHQQSPEKLGQWISTTMTLNYDSNMSKRAFEDNGSSVLWSRAGRESTPYQKEFGQQLLEEQMYEDGDWVNVDQ